MRACQHLNTGRLVCPPSARGWMCVCVCACVQIVLVVKATKGLPQDKPVRCSVWTSLYAVQCGHAIDGGFGLMTRGHVEIPADRQFYRIFSVLTRWLEHWHVELATKVHSLIVYLGTTEQLNTQY